MDRMLPVSMFEEEKKGDTFTISISSILQEAVGRVIEHGIPQETHITLTHKKESEDVFLIDD
jgi:glycine cleavage system H lipoate-binding protein